MNDMAKGRDMDMVMYENQRLAEINRRMAILDYNSDTTGYRELGLKEGLTQGHEEDALNMLRDDMPWAQISKYTGVSEKRIAELSKLV